MLWLPAVLQGDSPATVVLRIMEVLGVPATVFLGLFLYDRLFLRKRQNGDEHRALTHAIDLAITKGFEQLRRDLETKVTNEHDQSRKDMRNAISEMALKLEYFTLERRHRERS